MLEVTSIALSILIQISNSFAVPQNLSGKDIKELYCLSTNIFFESRGEPLIGQIAVAQVVRNRVKNNNFPDTYCKVITEGPIKESWKTRQHKYLKMDERIYYPIKNKCQFSWYCDGRSDKIKLYNKSSKDLWKTSIATSMLVYFNLDRTLIGNSLHYYAHKKVYPFWAKKVKNKIIIGNHTFVEK